MSDIPEIKQKKSKACPGCNLYMLKRCNGGITNDRGTTYFIEWWCGRCDRTEPAEQHRVPTIEEQQYDEWVKLNSLDKNIAKMIKKGTL